MTPLKTWYLLHLSVLLIAPTATEVVQSMTQCGFLLGETNPQVPHILENGAIQGKNTYKVICQTYNDVRRFVTLYDTRNRIPVLSAYKFTGGEGHRPEPEPHWMMEPQLEDMRNGKDMQVCNRDAEYEKQAGDIDYREVDATRYDRGHLFPASYGHNDDDKISTFTLTNAVPQVLSFNRGSWARMEACVRCIMVAHCTDQNGNHDAYLMTGAQPSAITTINNRVNVPSLLWSAFCCYSNTQGWIAGAYWGNNVADKPGDPVLAPKTLDQLYEKLSDGEKLFEAFPESRCPQNYNLAGLFPRDQNCHCVRNP